MLRAELIFPVLALALVASVSPALAQDEDEAPAKPEKREKAPEVTGRNDALKAAFKEVAARTSPFVVKVGNDAYGVVLEGNLIVTTSAAAREHREVAVRGGGLKGNARVIGVDEGNAIALLEAPSAVKGIELANGEALRVGQFVVTVGSGTEALSVGVLSAKCRKVEPRDLSQSAGLMGLMSDGIDGPKRAYPKVLQHDAPMTDDTLGTALVDSAGKLIGVNVGTGYRGSSYAICSDDLMECVKALKAGKTSTPLAEGKKKEPEKPAEKKPEEPAKGKPYLGMNVAEHKDGSLEVEEIVPGGPADKAGLKVGDRISSADGTKLEGLDQLADYIASKKPGETIVLATRRGRDARDVSVKLGSK
ncbi:PDZ domain-containing protein [bacterium]|nr:PDZ domain-containing protein [bacterium]